jgi:polysaccharide pyruvyl transferase WcaK-like protein
MRLATILGPVTIGLEGSADRFVPASRLDQARPPFWLDHQPKNLGDWFITKATERILDFDELVVLTSNASQAAFDEVNATCQAVILKGGNYLHPNGLLTQFVGLDLLRRLTIPIVMFGAGVQAGPGERVEFQPDDIAILRYIHDSAEVSCVRGWSAAEALHDIGIDNTLVTGCPTLFWSREPTLQLRPQSERRAVFTFRDGLFTEDPAYYRNQFLAIERVRDLYSEVVVALQGEEIDLQDLYQARKWGAEYGSQFKPAGPPGLFKVVRTPLDVEKLLAAVHAKYGLYTRPALVEWVAANSFFSWDIVDYLDLARAADVVVGCRFHGNLLALANGTPAYYLTYDRRTEELVELLGLPSQGLADLDLDFDPRTADWTTFTARYRALYATMVEFLERNALTHRLKSPVVPAQGAAAYAAE